MKDRLTQLLEKKKISPAEFADMIGVQRSNVSHILNGRNNPGFSFIQKVLESFPDLNPRWLIMGEGDIFGQLSNDSIASKTAIHTNEDLNKAKSTIVPNLFTTEQKSFNESVIPPKQSQPSDVSMLRSEPAAYYHTAATKPDQKTIVRTMIFYDDNTFDDFSPAKKL
jgi:transcriptional regulator with XRE-family HTH domain